MVCYIVCWSVAKTTKPSVCFCTLPVQTCADDFTVTVNVVCDTNHPERFILMFFCQRASAWRDISSPLICVRISFDQDRELCLSRDPSSNDSVGTAGVVH